MGTTLRSRRPTGRSVAGTYTAMRHLALLVCFLAISCAFAALQDESNFEMLFQEQTGVGDKFNSVPSWVTTEDDLESYLAQKAANGHTIIRRTTGTDWVQKTVEREVHPMRETSAKQEVNLVQEEAEVPMEDLIQESGYGTDTNHQMVAKLVSQAMSSDGWQVQKAKDQKSKVASLVEEEMSEDDWATETKKAKKKKSKKKAKKGGKKTKKSSKGGKKTFIKNVKTSEGKKSAAQQKDLAKAAQAYEHAKANSKKATSFLDLDDLELLESEISYEREPSHPRAESSLMQMSLADKAVQELRLLAKSVKKGGKKKAAKKSKKAAKKGAKKAKKAKKKKGGLPAFLKHSKATTSSGAKHADAALSKAAHKFETRGIPKKQKKAWVQAQDVKHVHHIKSDELLVTLPPNAKYAFHEKDATADALMKDEEAKDPVLDFMQDAMRQPSLLSAMPPSAKDARIPHTADPKAAALLKQEESNDPQYNFLQDAMSQTGAFAPNQSMTADAIFESLDKESDAQLTEEVRDVLNESILASQTEIIEEDKKKAAKKKKKAAKKKGVKKAVKKALKKAKKAAKKKAAAKPHPKYADSAKAGQNKANKRLAKNAQSSVHAQKTPAKEMQTFKKAQAWNNLYPPVKSNGAVTDKEKKKHGPTPKRLKKLLHPLKKKKLSTKKVVAKAVKAATTKKKAAKKKKKKSIKKTLKKVAKKTAKKAKKVAKKLKKKAKKANKAVKKAAKELKKAKKAVKKKAAPALPTWVLEPFE